MEKIVETPAKINLFLYIEGKREDGYHTLYSVFQTVSLYDILIATFSDRFRLEIKGEFSIKVTDNNTIFKVKRLLEEKGIKIPNIKLTLVKNIPVGAGLGGGSSDAAGFIKILKMFDIKIDRETEEDILKRVGADCPFFIKGGSAVVRGIGEVIEPIELPSFSLLLVKPPFDISTAWAYRAYDDYFLTNNKLLDKISIQSLTNALMNKTRIRGINSFEPVIFERYSKLKDISDYLWESGFSLVSLSGSGSSIFAVTKDLQEANEVGKDITQLFGWKWWALQTTV